MRFLFGLFKALVSAALALFGVACLLVAYDRCIRDKYPGKYINMGEYIDE